MDGPVAARLEGSRGAACESDLLSEGQVAEGTWRWTWHRRGRGRVRIDIVLGHVNARVLSAGGTTKGKEPAALAISKV
jgi:hypothetical protein